MDTESSAHLSHTLEADKIPPKRQPSTTPQCSTTPFGVLNNVLEFISRTNLFMLCCIAACLSLVSYLAAFSCEISWILEAHGNLPTTSYLLCSGYFILFVASTILIHGLATGLPWGLFSWSVIIAILGIPELCLVMMITTQFWGLQSVHGLTELIGYIIRLIVNCLALLCVIPTALRWRRERQVLKQLQGLASRLQLQTPPPSTPKDNSMLNGGGMQQHHMQQQQLSRQGSRAATKSRSRRNSGVDNPAFIVHESQVPFSYSYGVYGSQNEFNASVFGLSPSQYGVGSMPPPNMNPSRTRSLLDLRNVVTTSPHTAGDPSTAAHTRKTTIPDHTSDAGEPMYYTIGSEKDASIGASGPRSLPIITATPMMRNCVSMENLGGVQQHMMMHTADAQTVDEQHRRNALMMQQHPLSPNYNPAAAAEAAAAAAANQSGGEDAALRTQLQHHHHHARQQTLPHHPKFSNKQPLLPLQQHHQIPRQHQQHYPLGMYQPHQWPPPPGYPPNSSGSMHPQDYWNWSRYAYGMMSANDARRFVHPYLMGHHHHHQQQQQQQQPQMQPHHHHSRSTMNSKQSLGSDDFRKYRDVAL